MKHLQVTKPFAKHSYFLSDPDEGISPASNNLSQLPPVVIVPGVQNSRTEERERSKLRADLWVPLQLKRVHEARLWQSMGRAGLWKEKIDPSPFSRAGSMGNHTKVKIIVTCLCRSETLQNPWLGESQPNPSNLFLSQEGWLGPEWE